MQKTWIFTRYNLLFPPENAKSPAQSHGSLTNPLVRPKWMPQYSVSFINSEHFVENYIFCFCLFFLFGKHFFFSQSNRWLLCYNRVTIIEVIFLHTCRLSIIRQSQKWHWYWLPLRLPSLVWLWQLLVIIFQKMEAAVTFSISMCQRID